MGIAEREKTYLAELNSMDDWRERYGYIIDLGSTLEPFPAECKRSEFKVQGCVSQLWLVPQKRDGRIYFLADSDSLFVKGLAALLIKIFSDSAPEDILSHNANFLMESGLVQNLSPNRVNGAAALFARMKDLAKSLA